MNFRCSICGEELVLMTNDGQTIGLAPCEACIAESRSPFERDPFLEVVRAFERLWPHTPLPVIRWVEGLHTIDESPWATTEFPDDAAEPIWVSIDVRAEVWGAVELLAHELAHVACEHLGLAHADHGPHWEAVFDRLHEEYCRRMADHA